MAIQVKTIGASGNDSEEVDRELSLRLSSYETARNWHLVHVETVESKTANSGGRNVVATVVRAYFREGK